MSVLDIGIVLIAWVGVLGCVVATCAAAGRADRLETRLRAGRLGPAPQAFPTPGRIRTPGRGASVARPAGRARPSIH
jgi:hypothetical protein